MAPSWGPYYRSVRRLRRSPSAWLGGMLVLFFMTLAVGAERLVPYGIHQRHEQLAAPSWEHPLGTDALQYDVLTRVAYGSRLSLLASFISISLALILGSAIGALAGYFGGWIDDLLMRGIDVFLAFPSILVALLVVAAYRPGWPAVILSVAVINIPVFARQVRASVLSIRNEEHVHASRALGASSIQILVRGVLPGLISPVLVLATLGLGTAILEVASLAYLGVAGDPTVPEWGSMLNQAKEHLHASIWPAVAPGCAISLTILGFNLLGDGLRDALDPRASTTG